ncbi:zinc transporter subunit: ATP-binding component of ABC superfamily [Methylacidimicrobium sp. AP8]|uniref:metal ABC transporter ATP-binding protein n=1 Tax=Methylacidimicrobium sp. AP8 TaxID=2730359 RepID=UPI0018BFBED5|nr:metal ABC transporter ATP-binding protein [Methylacidimicrobium sp. AP8]CAB4243126.1 zinc transporter subunit: ATP-binding component of ABC superfamily [Methylacidimicrobium sp. AP8]
MERDRGTEREADRTGAPRRHSAGRPLLLRTRGLSAGYGDEAAFEGVSLEVFGREIVSLIGPNGAGKTALLRCLAGILPPRAGSLEKAPGLRLGYLPQKLAFDRLLPITVGEFFSLRLGRPLFGSGGWGGERIEGLDELGVFGLLGRRLGELSGGELQRVLVAAALAKRPQLLLLDEPATGVDLLGAAAFDALLHRLRDRDGLGILLVSHDLQLVHHIADWVYFLNRRILAEGPPQEVLRAERLADAYRRFPHPGWG